MSSSRQIAVVGACPYPVAQGSQVYLTESARTYQELGHEVDLCVYGYGAGSDPEGLTIHRAPMIPFARRVKAGPSWAKPLLDWRMISFLRRLVTELNIEVIDAHNYEALMVSLAARACPVIYHAHNAMADELPYYRGFGRIGRPLGAWLDRRYPRRADAIIAPHERLRDYLVENGCESDRITVIPPGIDPEPFVHEKKSSENPVVVYSGNMDAYQNPGMLKDVMTRIGEPCPDSRRVVATDDADALDYADVVSTANFGALRELLASDAVFICPRVSWSGYPIKLLNAMAAGLPVVACRSSAYPVVDGETGYVVEDGDVDAMAAKVVDLLGDAISRRRMGEAARNRSVDLYAQRGMIDAVIEQVLS